MNRLFLVLVLLLACIAGFGFYRGWFSFSKTSTDQKTNMTVTVDKDKIHHDEDAAKERVQEFGYKVKGTIGGAKGEPKAKDDPKQERPKP